MIFFSYILNIINFQESFFVKQEKYFPTLTTKWMYEMRLFPCCSNQNLWMTFSNNQQSKREQISS